MYGYIKGTVKKINSTSIIVDNNEIGYNINVSNPYSYKIDNDYLIYTYTYVKEDEFSLYGFLKEEEKDLFLKLLSVKGIGPKGAITILASSTVEGLMDAIDRENILYLKKIPKIGEKAARQIILDLKGKLTSNPALIQNTELYDALLALGYKQKDVSKVANMINMNESIENQIKEALRLLLK